MSPKGTGIRTLESIFDLEMLAQIASPIDRRAFGRWGFLHLSRRLILRAVVAERLLLALHSQSVTSASSGSSSGARNCKDPR
jgi:hypothetical protein